MTVLIGAIADDLTGATDLGLMFANNGMTASLLVGVPEAPDAGAAEATIVALKSRTIPADDAVAQSVASARWLLENGAQQLYFKYCSTFDSTDRGNIGPVIDAFLELLGESTTIACPAFPANGRTVYKGHLFVGDALLSESSMRDHPLTPMRDANLVRVLQRQSRSSVWLADLDQVRRGHLGEALSRHAGIAIVDAVHEDDLRAIGRAAAALKLITGGSGLAMGLPANSGRSPRAAAKSEIKDAPRGLSVILAGSCSVRTRAQIRTAEGAGAPAFALDADAIMQGTITVGEVVTFVLSNQGGIPPIVFSSATPEAVVTAQQKFGRDVIGNAVETFLGHVAAALFDKGTRRFLVAGGETSGAVIAALELQKLVIGPEIDPGVPWTTGKRGSEPLALALKSGNFGSEDMFVKSWAQLG